MEFSLAEPDRLMFNVLVSAHDDRESSRPGLVAQHAFLQPRPSFLLDHSNVIPNQMPSELSRQLPIEENAHAARDFPS